MIITPGALDAATNQFDLSFRAGLGSVQPLWPRIATRVTSATRQSTFPVPGKLPKLRKWQGERKAVNGRLYAQTLVNEKYELTLEIPREDFEDDLLNAYGPIVEDMGNQSAMWPDDLVAAALLAGETEKGYDGAAFFSTSHKLGGKANVVNLKTSCALTLANYATARADMYSFKGEDGESLRIRPNLLVVPPQLEKTALEIVKATTIGVAVNSAAAGQTNVLAGTADVLVLPQLSDEATNWYLGDMSGAMKPLLFQERQAPEITARMNLQDPSVFERDVFTWGVRARGVAGYGFFAKMIKCKA